VKVTDSEVEQIKRLSESSSIKNLSSVVLKSLSPDTLSRIVAGFLYLKSSGRSDKDFATYLATKETWDTLAIGLNIMGALIPAMIFDKEFRVLAMKTGLNKGMEVGSGIALSKISESDTKKI